MATTSKTIAFSIFEKNLLSNLILDNKNYKVIIENKKTDNITLARKESTWAKISAEFNFHSGVNCREQKQLKLLYKNLKAKAKKDVSREKREQHMTGCGLPPTAIDSISKIFAQFLPQQFDSLPNSYNDDACFNKEAFTGVGFGQL
ncbi:hypothetical protein HHUSO_G5309 [Huso huso]|uniref:Myb/SANT-like DNA-binding domain-containing protein n=1 Tax=Huso huso TaxID=61971 RepID=A0ABR1A0U3_HUSHU